MGAPVAWVPLDPVSLTLQAAGITAKAPHPNAARLFLDFMISRAGQEVFRDRDYIPMHPDVPAKNPAAEARDRRLQGGGLQPRGSRRQCTSAGRQIFQEIFR